MGISALQRIDVLHQVFRLSVYSCGNKKKDY